MSGIGGIISPNAAGQIGENMYEALKERGADTHGAYISKELCLIHTGYKEPTGGKQPTRAVFGQKACVVAIDGELYNSEELQKELAKLGHKLADTSDAAVVAHCYMAWGQSCPERMNGIFAFAVWDGEGLFFARDRLGVCPLFYSVGTYGLVFASNIKGILAHPQIEPVIGEEGILEILMLGPGRSPANSIFKNIKELAPGECAYYKDGLKTNTYWRLSAKTHLDSFAQTVETVRHLLTDTVKRQAAKGGRVSNLSLGGLGCAALANITRANNYSINFVGSQSEDNEQGVTRIILGSDQLADALETAILTRGLPGMADIDAALLLSLQHLENAVFLSTGAEEIFGGHPWYQDEELKTFPWAQNVEYRAKFIKQGICQASPQEYVRHRYERAIQAASTLYDDDKKETQIRQLFNLNLGWFLQTQLSSNDSMSVKVRIRTPFLDHRLVEYMYNVPWEMKTGLLREILQVSEKTLTREKNPLAKTQNPGYTRRVQDMLKDVLNQNAPIFELVSKKALSELLETQTINWYGQLMAYPQTIAYFLQINSWMENYKVKLG